MNIYDIFKRESPNKRISQRKLMDIAKKYNMQVPVNMLYAHRKIYHLQLDLSYWHPVYRNAKPGGVCGYIKNNGDVIDTTTVVSSDTWTNRTLYTGRTKLLEVLLRDNTRAYCLYRLQDRRYNVCLINEHTIPKWDPNSKTLCMDPETELTKQVDKLLKYNRVVLRCKELSPTQFELWTFVIKTKRLDVKIATVVGDTIAMGKTPKTSELVHARLTAKRMTEALADDSLPSRYVY